MTKQYSTLANKMVIVNPEIKTKEQAIALLKERTRKIDDYVVVKPQTKMQAAA